MHSYISLCISISAVASKRSAWNHDRSIVPCFRLCPLAKASGALLANASPGFRGTERLRASREGKYRMKSQRLPGCSFSGLGKSPHPNFKVELSRFHVYILYISVHSASTGIWICCIRAPVHRNSNMCSDLRVLSRSRHFRVRLVEGFIVDMYILRITYYRHHLLYFGVQVPGILGKGNSTRASFCAPCPFPSA